MRGQGRTPGQIAPVAMPALRLEIALSRDPMCGLGQERLFHRAVRAGVTAGAAAPMPQTTGRLTQPGAPAIESTHGHDEPRDDDGTVAHGLPDQGDQADSDQALVVDLLQRAQNGDGEAFGQLYDRYLTVVYRYVAYRVGNHSLAEDLTSETFMKALHHIGSFRWQGRDFGAWLITIARNLIADHYKSSRYKLEMTTADLVEAGVDGREDSPEDEVLDGMTNARLLDAVRSLRPEQQECIVLRFIQGMTIAETALVLRKNEQSVKALQYRAVKALGRLLQAEVAA